MIVDFLIDDVFILSLNVTYRQVMKKTTRQGHRPAVIEDAMKAGGVLRPIARGLVKIAMAIAGVSKISVPTENKKEVVGGAHITHGKAKTTMLAVGGHNRKVVAVVVLITRDIGDNKPRTEMTINMAKGATTGVVEQEAEVKASGAPKSAVNAQGEIKCLVSGGDPSPKVIIMAEAKNKDGTNHFLLMCSSLTTKTLIVVAICQHRHGEGAPPVPMATLLLKSGESLS